MSSMAQDAIDMGLDPVIAPDGREWCESSYEQSDISRELWGNLKDSCDNYDDYLSYDNNEPEDNTWYSCNECDWNGTSDELDEDGDCPECGSSVVEDNEDEYSYIQESKCRGSKYHLNYF